MKKLYVSYNKLAFILYIEIFYRLKVYRHVNTSALSKLLTTIVYTRYAFNNNSNFHLDFEKIKEKAIYFVVLCNINFCSKLSFDGLPEVKRNIVYLVYFYINLKHFDRFCSFIVRYILLNNI